MGRGEVKGGYGLPKGTANSSQQLCATLERDCEIELAEPGDESTQLGLV